MYVTTPGCFAHGAPSFLATWRVRGRRGVGSVGDAVLAGTHLRCAPCCAQAPGHRGSRRSGQTIRIVGSVGDVETIRILKYTKDSEVRDIARLR